MFVYIPPVVPPLSVRFPPHQKAAAFSFPGRAAANNHNPAQAVMASAFYSAGCHTFDKVFLEAQEQDQDRQYREK